jgi:hypothetical protein
VICPKNVQERIAEEYKIKINNTHRNISLNNRKLTHDWPRRNAVAYFRLIQPHTLKNHPSSLLTLYLMSESKFYNGQASSTMLSQSTLTTKYYWDARQPICDHSIMELLTSGLQILYSRGCDPE